MQDILAFADTYGAWRRSMHYAAELSATLGAGLTGVYVVEPFVPMPSMSLPVFPEVYSYTPELLEEARAAEPEFLRQAAEQGVNNARWLVIEGTVSASLAYAANWHDLLILESGNSSAWMLPGILGHVVLTCGSPAIVVPESFAGKASTDNIAIAWNGSPESIRALHAAMPLLRRAKKVTLLQGQRNQPFSSVECLPALDVCQWLAKSGICFSEVPFDAAPEDAGHKLLRKAHKVHADLLVMGAYGHSRFSEWVLGGATRYLLEHADIPVFVRH